MYRDLLPTAFIKIRTRSPRRQSHRFSSRVFSVQELEHSSLAPLLTGSVENEPVCPIASYTQCLVC